MASFITGQGVSGPVSMAASTLRVLPGTPLPSSTKAVVLGVEGHTIKGAVTLAGEERTRHILRNMFGAVQPPVGHKLVSTTSARLVHSFTKTQDNPYLKPGAKQNLLDDTLFIYEHGSRSEVAEFRALLPYTGRKKFAPMVALAINLLVSHWDHISNRASFLRYAHRSLPKNPASIKGFILEQMVFRALLQHPDTELTYQVNRGSFKGFETEARQISQRKNGTYYKADKGKSQELDNLAIINGQTYIFEVKVGNKTDTEQLKRLRALAQMIDARLVYVRDLPSSHNHISLGDLRRAAQAYRGEEWNHFLNQYDSSRTPALLSRPNTKPKPKPKLVEISQNPKASSRPQDRLETARQIQQNFRRQVGQKTRDAVALIDHIIYLTLGKENGAPIWLVLNSFAQQVEERVIANETAFLRELRHAIELGGASSVVDLLSA